jgi:TIR domain
MAYVPGFEHDIFVSYAHVDDKPAPNVQTGWVSTLVDGLLAYLPQKLGRAEAFDLWMDPRLSAYEPLTPAILNTIEKSAVLVVILSPAYLSSDWCSREFETFLKKMASQRARTGVRIFVVERDQVEPGEKPAAFHDLWGYRFWFQEPKSERTRILGDPLPIPEDPKHQPYYDKLSDLAHDLARELKRLKASAETPGTPQKDTRPAVFLADVTDDLVFQHDEVKRYLDQMGFRVLPEKDLLVHYLSDPDTLSSLMAQDLPSCRLFIQLLSNLPGRRPHGKPGFARVQFEAAQRAGTPILQWHAPQLAVKEVSDQEQRELLEGTTVFVDSLEAFKAEAVRRASPKPAPPKPSVVAENVVFIDAHAVDDALGKEIHRVVKTRGLGCVVPLRKGSPKQIRQDLEQWLLDCDGVLIVYGSVPQAWARERMRQCRKMKGKREQPLKVMAVYEGPPEDKEPLGIDLGDVVTLNGREGFDENALKPFFEALHAGMNP